MNGVKIIYKVKLALTEDDWQLYNMPGSKKAAREINTKVAKALNNNDIQGAYEVLQEYREYGATDTEPTAVLNEIMDKMGFA
jgi:hypothetical protein